MTMVADVDGTILHDDTLSDRVRDALSEWVAAGHRLIPATGRPWRAMHSLRETGLLRPGHMILVNGAHIVSPTGDSLYQRALDVAPLASFLETALVPGRMLAVETAEGGFYYPENLFPVWHYRDMSRLPSLDELLTLEIVHLTLASAVDEADSLDELIVNQINGGLVGGFFASRNDEFVDIGHRDVTKAGGVNLLRQVLDTGDGQWVAIGDSGNDVPMFAASNRAITFMDSPEPVRRAAGLVVADLPAAVELLLGAG